ncbi:prepilin-type N-terminal cleavage/methylation domain-containing protein [Finegoldia magna]|uniref:Prepilin-type cleavage/methylation N-terminal domain protein n=1 Tax=Finegoldia magna BVS033A4 TaxID=866773 RepID=E1KYA2_FINMA|nr:prepilin-type N-terminal cleavage/methylation domain-containing protein [Finegoldia magna]EFL53974.1 prepilin-type cleavage/methylation N-terminal domain protein [Finegoldia magna BVS033A4]
MFSKLKTRKKAFSLIEVMVSLFIISVVVMTCVLKYDLKSDVASRKEINTLISDLKTARSVAMNSGRSINFKFDENSYSFYDTTPTDTTTTYFTVRRDLKYGKIQTTNDRKKNALSFDNFDARISKSAGSSRFQTIYYITTNKKYRINCYIATGRVDVDEIKK